MDRTSSASLTASWILRGLLFLLGLGLVWVAAPNLVTATLRSPQALAVVAGIVAAFLGLSWLLRRVGVPRWAASTVLAATGIGVAWLLLAPALSLRDTEVVEALPGVAAAQGGPAVPARTEPSPEPAAGELGPTGTGLPVAERTDPQRADPGRTDPGRTSGEESPEPTPPPTEPPPTATPTPAEPTLLASGALAGIDHLASGNAALYELADGSVIVRLEDIDVENGPDYVLYLVPSAGARGPDGGIDLGPLKGNQGSHNYPLPTGTDLPGDVTVLIWCRAFAVPIASAIPTGS